MIVVVMISIDLAEIAQLPLVVPSVVTPTADMQGRFRSYTVLLKSLLELPQPSGPVTCPNNRDPKMFVSIQLVAFQSLNAWCAQPEYSKPSKSAPSSGTATGNRTSNLPS